MPVEIPVEKFSGAVREITIGATKEQGGTRAKTVTIGGDKTLPYLQFEASAAHPPVIAIEIQDRAPSDWSEILLKAWGDVVKDPVAWAKVAEAKGAEIILLKLNATLADGSKNTADNAKKVVRAVLNATGLPLIVFGPGQAELDNELLVAVAEETKASAFCWVCAKTKTIARLSRRQWQTIIWWIRARRWT